MSKDPYDKIVAAIIDEVASEIAWLKDDLPGDSAIERLFITALCAKVRWGSNEFTNLMIAKDAEATARLMNRGESAWRELYVEPQKQLEGWRVDYLIHAYHTGWNGEPQGWRSLIVECDGHQFHERTKEQAARDRARDREFQSKGIPVFRFTGSELWRDAWGCADQVIAWAQKGV